MVMLTLKNLPTVTVCRFLATDHLTDFGFMIGKVDKHPQIDIFGTYSVQPVDNQQLYLAEIRKQLIDFLCNNIDTGNEYLPVIPEIVNISV